MTLVTSPWFRSGNRLNARLIDKYFIYIAPAPVLTRLEGLNDGMFALAKVFGGMFVLRGIAAPNMATAEALPQMNPGIAHLQTFLATGASGLDRPDFSQVRTTCLCSCHQIDLRN